MWRVCRQLPAGNIFLFLSPWMGVAHCVPLPLTGTTVAPSWAHSSLVGDWFVQLHSLSDIIHGNKAPLMLFVMGPHPTNIARGIQSVFVYD